MISFPCAPIPPLVYRTPAVCEIYPPSLHDALPIFGALAILQHAAQRARLGQGIVDRFADREVAEVAEQKLDRPGMFAATQALGQDRKSTRLNSSHVKISYAVSRLYKELHLPGSRYD